MIWSYRDLLGTGDFRVCRIVPINVKLPRGDSIVFHDLLQLRAAGRHHDVGRASRWQSLAIKVRIVEKVYAVNDHTLLACRLALQHLCAIGDAGMLLDHFVAGTGGNVVAVGPNRRPRIVRKKRTQEFVAIVRAKWIGSDADRIAHRVRSLRSRRRRLATRLGRLVKLSRRAEKPDGLTGLIFFAGHAHLSRIAGATELGLVGAN